MRFEDMKRLGDWEYALGVNVMNQHLSFGTVAGARKYDYPQSFSYHEPWWKHYGVLANYFARLSLALSSGEEVNRVLVIEPTNSFLSFIAKKLRADRVDRPLDRRFLIDHVTDEATAVVFVFSAGPRSTTLEADSSWRRTSVPQFEVSMT